MDPDQLRPGYRLDRYELLCPLAHGGMATVWLARFGGHLGFERMVVVKMILPQYSQDPRFQKMFLDEARIASRIEHSNVARILDVGEHDTSYFIVLEWVDGDSVSKILRAATRRKERPPLGVTARILADAAAGLHAAHELKDRDGNDLGVVHRDVSPQNILVSNDGATKIIDFGVAKARDRISQDTSAGQLKGKIRYMAPEQALGRPLDRRADVWALGAVLYEMLAGRPPYDAPSDVATLHLLMSGAAPTPLPRDVPDPLHAIIDRTLAYHPEQRFATARELNVALEAAMVEIGAPSTPSMVAEYTATLLAERKGARRRAVDAALEAARRRDAGVAPSSTTLPVSMELPVAATSSARALPRALSVDPALTLPSSPSNAIGVGEVPSATSTLGYASMEYLPAALPDPRARSRRYFVAAALGSSAAAAVIGAALTVTSFAVHRTKPPTQEGAHAAAAPPAEAPAARPASSTRNAHAPPEPVIELPAGEPGAEPAPAKSAAPEAASAHATARNASPQAVPSLLPVRPPVVHEPSTSPAEPAGTRIDRGL